MKFPTSPSPHLALPVSVTQIMKRVLLALVPGTAALVWFFGLGVLTNLLLAISFCVASEAAVIHLRKRPLDQALGDYSAVVTGWLLGIALPPLSPWWLILVASVFAIVVAKQLYGGLGYNPFNPAMVGYVVVLISFPVEMTAWLAPELPGPGLGEAMAAVLSSGAAGIDGATGATALDVVKTQLTFGRMISEISGGPAFGHLGSAGTEWVAMAFLLGGLWMVWMGVTSWRIPAATLAGIFLCAGFFWALDPETHASPLFHLFSGGAMLGAFFIATDPVSACTTPRGRLIFGIGVGGITYVIRAWGGYPEGIAFAVLLMNMMAPTIDHYTRPRVFGHDSGS